MDALDFSALAKNTESEHIAGTISIPTLNLISDIKKAIYQDTFPDSLQTKKTSLCDSQQHLAEASKLIDQGHFRTAELLLTGILELIPHCEEAIQKVAEINEKEGAFIKTVAYASKLRDKGINSSELNYQQAYAYYRLGRHDEALETILPQYICNPALRDRRLCGLILHALGKWSDAIELLEQVIKESPRDAHSIRALSQAYSDLGLYDKGLDTRRHIPSDLADNSDKLSIALLHRMMGELEVAIQLNSEIIADNPSFSNALWTQCFNYSIANAEFALALLETSKQFWQLQKQAAPDKPPIKLNPSILPGERLRIAFLSSDIGEHVVSRFLAPILRHYNRDKYHITLLSTYRRFEEKASEIVTYADAAISLQGLNTAEIYSCIEAVQAHVIIETNGFTRNSGIGLLAQRCAPIQCHYLGYHGTTGLDTIDYFLGDGVTLPEEYQSHYIERIAQIPSLWMAYDSMIQFPKASSTAQRDSPVLGSFSQMTKINSCTLEYWAEALNAIPDSILVIKDRGCCCLTSCRRVEETLQSLGVDPGRIYFIGPVSTHLDHLDSYKAIDIALDTTPWSSATTAFEALGMGVPLVTICGNTTAGRMSTSVVSAAGMDHWIAHSKEEFGKIASELAKDYKQLRKNKPAMQKQMRSGILFDEQRICRDFYATIDRLVANHLNGDECEK